MIVGAPERVDETTPYVYIKAEFAKALFQPRDFVPSWNNYMYSGGVRLMYLC